MPEKQYPSMNRPEVNSTAFTPRLLPTFPYVAQNVLYSLAQLVVAAASLFLTVFLFIPLSLLRVMLPKRWLQPVGMTQQEATEKNKRNRVVLVVGASRGIGFSVMKQYVNEPDTIIIAASRRMDHVRSAVARLGKTPATIHCAEIDLNSPNKHIVDAIKQLDKQYGPITHLYEVSGLANNLDDSKDWDLDVVMDLVNVNVVGTITAVMTMYDLMKERRYGKICVVGSTVGHFFPANTLTYSATKSLVNSFTTGLRVLGTPVGVEVTSVQPGFIDTRMTDGMKREGSTAPKMGMGDPNGLARTMKQAVEGGGVGVVCWPGSQGMIMFALRALNPICDDFGKWVSMKLGLAGRKIS
ncbi:NAD(P)-binding protein [Agrocybe pediades]|nr:NAD(P)-binding protein [Agrocybe pediades]